MSTTGFTYSTLFFMDLSRKRTLDEANYRLEIAVVLGQKQMGEAQYWPMNKWMAQPNKQAWVINRS